MDFLENNTESESLKMEDLLSTIDRISDLPNNVLINILSLMSTKEAAPTFLLSKRWNKIWSSLPCLKFDYREFLPEVQMGDYGEFVPEDQLSEVRNAKFIEFVNGVLRHRGTTPVDNFWLLYGSENISPHPAMEWVDHIVVNCKPRVLILDIFVEDHNFCIPSVVFSCASLEAIQLILRSENYDVHLPDQVSLPSLKILKLIGTMLDNGFFKKLFLGSSLLQTLVLGSCMLVSTLQISSSLLKHFSLRCCDQRVDVQIDAPSLIYLDIQCNESARIFLKNLRLLTGARIQINEQYMFGLNKTTYSFKHISALSNATTLDLTFTTNILKGKLEKELINFPTFINLKELVIGKWCMVNDFDLVAAFLQHSPNLQMLKLFHIWCHRCNLQEIARHALKEYLQTVVIHAGSIKSPFDMDILQLYFEDEADEKAKNESVDLLVKQLRTCVRTIGEITIIKPETLRFELFDEMLSGSLALFDSLEDTDAI